MDRSKVDLSVGNIWMIPYNGHPVDPNFHPIFKSTAEPATESERKLRLNWSQAEDEELKKIITEKSKKNWGAIAKELNTVFHQERPNRTRKQCKERWTSHLKPALMNSKWSREEDLILLQKQREIGNKWTELSKFFEERTAGQIKSRWKSLARAGVSGRCFNEKEKHKGRSFKLPCLAGIDDCDQMFSLNTNDNTPKDYEGDNLMSLHPQPGFYSARRGSFTEDREAACDYGLDLADVKFDCKFGSDFYLNFGFGELQDCTEIDFQTGEKNEVLDIRRI